MSDFKLRQTGNEVQQALDAMPEVAIALKVYAAGGYNMNACLKDGVYVGCTLGRPAGSVEGETYTLQVVSGGKSGETYGGKEYEYVLQTCVSTKNKNHVFCRVLKTIDKDVPEPPVTVYEDWVQGIEAAGGVMRSEFTQAIADERNRAQQAERANANAIATEKNRAEAAEQINAEAIAAEKTRAQTVEQGLAEDISDEAARAKTAEQANADAIAAEAQRAQQAEGVNANAIAQEVQRAQTAEGVLETAIGVINGKIPAQATAQNQLADKDFVNSSIATATADFKGTYNSLEELEQVTADANDYAYVIATDAEGNTVYKRYKWVEGTGWMWEYDLNNSSFTAAEWAAIQSGITAALVTKLTALPTNDELNQRISNAIATALSGYYTKAEVDTALANKASQTALNNEVQRAQQAEQANADNITFINKGFGKYDGQRELVLQQAKAGKYVNTDGGETSASGYGISAPVTLNAGDILLIPSAQAVPASVSVVARMVDRTYQKVIAYIYAYRTDYPELPATATADYDSTLVYTAVYDESGDTPALTGWTRGGQTYSTLPATREVSEQFYEPLVRQAVSAMPSTGYYIYLSPTAMTVVVSGLTATVSGGVALVVGWSIFKNITTNFVGAPGQSVLAQAFAVLFAAIDGLRAQLDNLGETKAVSIDFEEQPKLCGQPLVVEGSGAPASPVVPTKVGQRYHDTINNKCYEAFRVTNSVSDWVLLN